MFVSDLYQGTTRATLALAKLRAEDFFDSSEVSLAQFLAEALDTKEPLVNAEMMAFAAMVNFRDKEALDVLAHLRPNPEYRYNVDEAASALRERMALHDFGAALQVRLQARIGDPRARKGSRKLSLAVVREKPPTAQVA
ncbi:hypothetical protein KW797_02235 [Candidatus Parcubacteria bacterium]|nr:hypothetical protein [Candidatus Parcubacteria bacterium]